MPTNDYHCRQMKKWLRKNDCDRMLINLKINQILALNDLCEVDMPLNKPNHRETCLWSDKKRINKMSHCVFYVSWYTNLLTVM